MKRLQGKKLITNLTYQAQKIQNQKYKRSLIIIKFIVDTCGYIKAL